MTWPQVRSSRKTLRRSVQAHWCAAVFKTSEAASTLWSRPLSKEPHAFAQGYPVALPKNFLDEARLFLNGLDEGRQRVHAFDMCGQIGISGGIQLFASMMKVHHLAC